MTVLPRSLREELAGQVVRAREFWRKDREEGLAGVWLPGALARKTTLSRSWNRSLAWVVSHWLCR